MISIYCDGGCAGNQHDENIGGWGVVLTDGNHFKELYGGARNTTNNVMELTALIEGLSALKRLNGPVRVFSDSAYIVNCFHQKWYEKWQRNGWKTSKKQPVENKQLWQTLLQLVGRHDSIFFYKIKGHLDSDDARAIEKWHSKFIKDYQINMPYDIYRQAVIYNNRADALANKAISDLREEIQ